MVNAFACTTGPRARLNVLPVSARLPATPSLSDTTGSIPNASKMLPGITLSP
jgi:hypothetical protein